MIGAKFQEMITAMTVVSPSKGLAGQRGQMAVGGVGSGSTLTYDPTR